MPKPGEKDYRSLSKNGKPPQDAGVGADLSTRWWDYDAEDDEKAVTDAVQARVNFLQKSQSPRMQQQIVSARLYGNMSMGVGGSSAAYGRLATQNGAAKERMTYNATQSIVDTLTSHIGEQKPRPFYLTSGGDYRQQRKAKKLSQFSDGIFYETQTYRLAPQVFRDALIWGDGFMHVFARGNKLCHERVVPSEIWVDEVEGQYGYPRNLDRVKDVDRAVVMATWPEYADRIKQASRAPAPGAMSANISDMMTVIESYHLGARNEDGELVGGKRIVSLPSVGLVLEEEDWEHDFFPFARMSWCRRPLGYWSQGLCEQLMGSQIWLNKMLNIVQRSMQIAGTVKVLLPNGSKIVKEHINNDIGSIINYAGNMKPEFFVAQPVHQMFLEEINSVIERMYRLAGVSELSASNAKPAGLDSKPSLREYKDTQNERHKATAEGYDDFFLQIASMDRALAKGLKGYKVRVPGKSSVNEIDYAKDIGKTDDEEFILQCFPVSQLPRDPAGRMQTVQEWVQAGWITPRQARRAMDFPDLDTIESLANAQEDCLQQTLDLMIDDGEYRGPEPTDDLDLNEETAIQSIQKYRQTNLEKERMDLLRNFLTATRDMKQRAAASMAPPPGMAPPSGTPQAQPAPAPVSQMLPQAA